MTEREEFISLVIRNADMVTDLKQLASEFLALHEESEDCRPM